MSFGNLTGKVCMVRIRHLSLELYSNVAQRFAFWQLAKPYAPYGDGILATVQAKKISLVFDDDPRTRQNITLKRRDGPQLWALVPVDAKKVNITFTSLHGWWHKHQKREVEV